MSMRAQVSLQFDDADLFDNFIIPYKENRLLNSLIIKCLSSYYYNEDVRNLIEGTSIDDVTEDDSVASNNQSIFDSMRASLLMQDFFASELQNTIDNGTEDVENILHQTNDLAKKSGVAKPSTSEYGSSILQITTSNNEKSSDSGIPEGNAKVTTGNVSFDILVNAVLKLAEFSGNNEVVNMLHQSTTNSSNSENEVVSETSSLESTEEVPIDDETIPTAFEEPITNNIEIDEDFAVEEEVPQINDFDDDSEVDSNVSEDVSNFSDIAESPSVVETSEDTNTDASDSMKELLDSLL